MIKRYDHEYYQGTSVCNMVNRKHGEWVKWDDVKKFVAINCDRAEKTADGSCLGYGKSEIDDEPIEACKRCEKQSSYESEGDNALLGHDKGKPDGDDTCKIYGYRTQDKAVIKYCVYESEGENE